MMESQLEVIKGSDWDEILKQGDVSSFEEIQDAIRHDDSLDNFGQNEVQSDASSDGAEVIVPGQIDAPADVVTQDVPEQPQEESVSQQTNETVVIFPDDDQPQGKHFAPED